MTIKNLIHSKKNKDEISLFFYKKLQILTWYMCYSSTGDKIVYICRKEKKNVLFMRI